MPTTVQARNLVVARCQYPMEHIFFQGEKKFAKEMVEGNVDVPRLLRESGKSETMGPSVH